MRTHPNLMAAVAMLAGAGMISVGGYGAPEAIEARPEMRVRKRPVQTQTKAAEPVVWENASVNTRQVRRQRERLAAKGRTDEPRSLHPNFGRSKYMPHIGAKERGRYAA